MAHENHTPNVIPKKSRIALFAAAVLLLVFICAEITTGYTYIPGRRGGFLVNGLATLFVIVSASGFLFSCALKIIDHYDKRPNEKSYAILIRKCVTTSLCLFFIAPFVHLLQITLLIYGFDISQYIHGLDQSYAIFNPKFYSYVAYIKPITSNAGAILLFVIVTIVIAILIKNIFSATTRLTGVLAGIAFLALSLLVLATATEDFLSGYVSVGGRAYIALKEPAKFNAVLISSFSFGGGFLILSVFSIINSITDKLKS